MPSATGGGMVSRGEVVDTSFYFARRFVRFMVPLESPSRRPSTQLRL